MILFNREKIKSFCSGIGSLFFSLAAALLISIPVAVSAQSPDKPRFWIPPVVNLKNMVGAFVNGRAVENKRLLSVGSDGSYADMYDKDDNSGRQRWIFQRSADGNSYNILVGGGTPSNRKYLSVNSEGSKVALSDRDDGSGRQRWIIEVVPNSAPSYQPGNDKYSIRISRGVTNTSKYLSITTDGSKVDLYHKIDGSRRQLWEFAIPKGIKFNLQVSGGVTSGRTLLSTPASLTSIDLFDKDDNSGRQQWVLESTPYWENYRILMKDKCLTLGDVSNDRAVAPVTLTSASDVNRSETYWKIEDIGSGLIRIKPASLWKTMYLSTTADGVKVDMFGRDDASGRQRWKTTIIR